MTDDNLIGEVNGRRAAAPSIADQVDALRQVEGIRDPVPLQQLCPICKNRGFVQHHGASTPCNCPIGRQIVYRDAALKTLTAMYGPREAVRWLEDWNQELRSRPVHLLRNDDSAHKVFEVIRREATVRGIEPPVLPKPTEPAPLSHLPSLRDTARQRMIADLRRIGRVEAAQLFADNKIDAMKDDDRAHLDALMVGTGYLVDGKRVDPGRVQVIRFGRHPASPNPDPR